jgi:hypothetical protein
VFFSDDVVVPVREQQREAHVASLARQGHRLTGNNRINSILVVVQAVVKKVVGLGGFALAGECCF